MSRNARVVHASMETGEHVVGIGNLRVFLVEDGGSWYAHGLEIDYVAQGDSIDEAKKNFEIGLTATIQENLKIVGSIAPILNPAPSEIWREWLDPGTKAKWFSSVSFHTIAGMDNVLPDFPFQAIDYLMSEAHV